jgi:hypothetical protein
MWLDIKHWKNPSCMTKYFDKLPKIKFYIICYPSHGNMKKNAILGHVDFFWNSLNITNKNIFHDFMSKNSKNIFIQINLWARVSSFNYIIGIKFLFNFMVSKTLAICFPFFGIFFNFFMKIPQICFSHYLEIHIKWLVTLRQKL